MEVQGWHLAYLWVRDSMSKTARNAHQRRETKWQLEGDSRRREGPMWSLKARLKPPLSKRSRGKEVKSSCVIKTFFSYQCLSFLKKKKLMFMFERQSDTVWAGEGQRERETQNLKQAPGSELSARSPTHMGLEPTNREIMTWAKVGCLTDWATQVPL